MPASLLCVQDDREVGRVYAEALEAEGYEVLSAIDGRSALAILRKHRPSLVVLDVYLSRQDGFEILAEMRTCEEFSASVSVLMLCEGDITEDLRRRAAKLGAVGVVSGPLEANLLVSRVAELLALTGEKSDCGEDASEREGSLAEIPMPELLRGVYVEGLDGVILFDHGKKKKALELRGGWPISVKSNLISECFGNYLINRGRCTKSQLDESIKRMKMGEGLQGDILVAMDVLDEEAVASALRDHALEKFFEIFSWGDGQFKVQSGAQIQKGASLGIDGHPSKLIVEGVRRYAALRRVDRYFDLHQAEYLVPLPSENEQLAEIDLSEAEADWLWQVDGSQTIASLVALPESIRRLAFGLISIEVFEVRSTSGSQEFIREAVGADSGDRRRDGENEKTDEEFRAELTRLANGIRGTDHYGTLGVASSALDEAIAEAFCGLRKRVHPDRFHSASHSVRQLASQVLTQITQAHAAIATDADRKTYAAELSRGRKAMAAEEEGRRALNAEKEYQRAEKLVAAKDYEGALLCFGRALEAKPSEGEYRSSYGWCLYLCHPDNEVMLGEALEHCRKGVKLAKDQEKPYLLLGRLYKAMGRVGAAKKLFTRAVEIRPQCVEAMRELRIMNMRRDKDKGVLKRIFRR